MILYPSAEYPKVLICKTNIPKNGTIENTEKLYGIKHLHSSVLERAVKSKSINH